MGQDLIEEKTIVKPMKYVKTTFKTFLKHRLNESVKLKTKEEEQPIEDMETDDEEDLEDIDPEDEPEELPLNAFIIVLLIALFATPATAFMTDDPIEGR